MATVAVVAPSYDDLSTIPKMLTYAEASRQLCITTRTLQRRVAAGRYTTYGVGRGKRVLTHSIVEDIRRMSELGRDC